MSIGLLGLSKKTIPQKIVRIREICEAVDLSKFFTDASPTTVVILAAVLLLEKYEADTKTTKAGAIRIRDLQLIVVMNLMNTFLSYAQTKSGGDAVKLESIKLLVKGNGTKPHIQDKVSRVDGKTGTIEGTVNLKWMSLKKFGARFYQIQFSADGKTGWINQGPNVTAAKTTVTGLIFESPGYYRIAAGNKLGLGEWSDVIRVMSK